MHKKIFKTAGLMIIFTFWLGQTWAQISITGKVTGEDDNQGLPGVNITVKGTTTGSVTDAGGNYRIMVSSPENTIVFSYMGYLSQETKVGNRAVINIVMKQGIRALDEVVVMGYSEKKKTEISSAVTVLPAEKLKDVVSSNLTTMLQGKVTGVQIVNSSGFPGSGAEIRIRGTSTLNGNSEPLFVVDGIISGYGDPGIDPSMVESVTILKDAGATGLYGAKANGGVVIINTKKGSAGKTKFEFSATVGFRTPDFGKVNMMTGSEAYEAHKGLFIDSTGYFDKVRFNNNYDKSLKERNFDWVNEVFQPALVSNYFLSAAGGKDKYSYFLGASYFNEKGTFMNTDYQKLNIRSNNNYQFSDRVSLLANIDLNVSSGHSYDYMDMYYTFLTLPWDSAYDANGNPKYVDQTTPGWYSRDKINPIHSIQNSDYAYRSASGGLQLGLNINILKWLTFSSSAGLSYWNSLATNAVYPAVAGPLHGIGSLYRQNDFGYGVLNTNLFKLSHSFGNHNLSGLIGFEVSYGYGDSWGASAEGLLPGFTVFNTASKNYKVFGSYEESSVTSFISQANYNYKEKYFLTGSFRIDNNSKFAPDHKTAYFPTLSGSWLMSKEEFMKNSESISNLKLRLSWGYTGNEAIDPGKYNALYSLTSTYNSQIGAIPFQLPNSELTWEMTRQLDFGVEIEFLKRFEIIMDLYQNKTKNLLFVAQQAYSIGYEYRWENAGAVTNTGAELGLSAKIIDKTDFGWNVDFNASYNKNLVSDIENAKPRIVGGIEQRLENDKPLYAFYLPVWLGVNPNNGEPLWEQVIRDENGNVIDRVATNQYSKAEAQYVGSAMPKYYGGLSTALRYKNWSLSLNFSYTGGNKVYNRDRSQFDTDGAEPLMNWMVPLDGWTRWEKPGDNATDPRMGANSLSYYPSSRYLEDGSYVKFRYARITYQFPGEWFKDKIGGLSITLSGDNLYTFTKYSGMDPEATLRITDWSLAGVNDLKYPLNRQYNLTVKLNF
jgi:TonB-linked SusC/RagA family outer membrane protein